VHCLARANEPGDSIAERRDLTRPFLDGKVESTDEIVELARGRAHDDIVNPPLTLIVWPVM
jgi:hypothetical protein